MPPLAEEAATYDLAGVVSRLFIHPVKSCAGIALQEALLTPTGLQWDRAWMVVDEDGLFLTQREWPRMALIQPEVTADALVLRAPGQPVLRVPLQPAGAECTVRIWRDHGAALDVGEEAARWFSSFLGLRCRLVRFDERATRLADPAWTGGVQAPVQFPDGYPLLVVSQAALDDLNARLADAGHAAIGIERFRPNLVIEGFAAHDEDHAELLHVDGGAIALRPVKPCARCPIPEIDPATGVPGRGVTEQLHAYRQDARVGGGLTFGMNALIAQGVGQRLRVGQRIQANLVF